MLRKFILISCIYCCSIFAASDNYTFADPKQQQLFVNLTQNLRCLVCQNQNIAESNAPLAQDLRREVVELINANKSETEIIEFLVSRYGEFILYKPEFNQHNYLLWLGPGIMLLIGGFICFRTIRQQSQVET